MVAKEKRIVGIFVDRACPERWIVRDPEGNFWTVPCAENPWDHRDRSTLPRTWNWSRFQHITSTSSAFLVEFRRQRSEVRDSNS